MITIIIITLTKPTFYYHSKDRERKREMRPKNEPHAVKAVGKLFEEMNAGNKA